MKETNSYVGWQGLIQASKEMHGSETMGIGIRPFGFHAGNMTSIVAYPILLCEEMRKLGKEPHFDLHCFLNDIEQHSIVGHEKDPDNDDEANIYPAGKTLQFTLAPDGFEGSVVDYWQPLITNGVMEITKRFPCVRLSIHKTSDLKKMPIFTDIVHKAIVFADEIADLTEQHLCMPVHRPADFVRAVCPACKVPAKNTKNAEEVGSVFLECQKCGKELVAPIDKLDWWLQHRIVTLPKLLVGSGFDVWMMGFDHYEQKETPVRLALAKMFGITAKNYTAIHAPLIHSFDGKKMGKSNHNVAYAALEDLLSLLRGNTDHHVPINMTTHSRDLSPLGKLLPKHLLNKTL